MMAEKDGEKKLIVFGLCDPAFRGEKAVFGVESATVCDLNAENAAALRIVFPFTAPVSLDGHRVTIGLGDRLGIVSGAHIKALQGTAAFPVLAQQSKRELTLTGRTNRSMMDDVAWQVFEAGYEGGYAADGDHLKTLEEVQAAVFEGDTMITLDCSEHIDSSVTELSCEDALRLCAERFGAARVEAWNARYSGKTIPLSADRAIAFSQDELPVICLLYGEAISFVSKVYHEVIAQCNHPVSLEISIDETETDTTPAAHWFFANELIERGVHLGSMAPRFCGEFQKGIDYIGNAEDFKRSFAVHALIAEKLGYRISVHSGSDKFSIFPYVGEYTGNAYHLKTSGTSWVEAVRVIAMTNPGLFRRMLTFSCEKYQDAKKFYHVSGLAENIPPVESLDDSQLPSLLDAIDSRQVMHITYGFLLQAKDSAGRPMFRDEIYATLKEHKDVLEQVISAHIRRHLICLGIAAD